MLLREHSALWYCGYTAAKKEGLSTRERHEIIDAFYSSELNPRLIKECGDQGCAKSYSRASKIASTLTAHIRNFSRNDAAPYAYAISVWEADLAYVRSRYLGSGDFHVLRMGSITA
jgi:hypothetical protein